MNAATAELRFRHQTEEHIFWIGPDDQRERASWLRTLYDIAALPVTPSSPLSTDWK